MQSAKHQIVSNPTSFRDDSRKNNADIIYPKKCISIRKSVNNDSITTVNTSSFGSSSNELGDPELITSKTSNPDFHTTNTCDFIVIGTKSDEKVAILKPSIEDVLSYILNNFSERYCFLNASWVHSLFPEKSMEDVTKWFEMKQGILD